MSGGISDNYKARYNGDPSQTEHRTWLSMNAIVAAGTTWAPQSPASDHATSTSVAVVAANGRTGTLSVAPQRGSLGLTVLRVDQPSGTVDHVRWGVLTTISDPEGVTQQSALVQLTLAAGGVTVATGVVEYRHEPAFDGVPSTHIEWNGPRGRWYVGGTALRTDWEPAAGATAPTATGPAASTNPAPAVVQRPRVVRIVMPLRTSNRHVTMRVSGRAGAAKITSIRFKIGATRYGAWMHVTSRYRMTLPARTATWAVAAQLRDARGAVSRPVVRRIRCNCG
ncbi:MAG: hypothetical protein JWN41_1166 [Thermoleophilia bacterium]|nr:hypothetical protein [Thermoleophilia bacterium]